MVSSLFLSSRQAVYGSTYISKLWLMILRKFWQADQVNVSRMMQARLLRGRVSSLNGRFCYSSPQSAGAMPRFTAGRIPRFFESSAPRYDQTVVERMALLSLESINAYGGAEKDPAAYVRCTLRSVISGQVQREGTVPFQFLLQFLFEPRNADTESLLIARFGR